MLVKPFTKTCMNLKRIYLQRDKHKLVKNIDNFFRNTDVKFSHTPLPPTIYSRPLTLQDNVRFREFTTHPNHL